MNFQFVNNIEESLRGDTNPDFFALGSIATFCDLRKSIAVMYM